MHDSGQTPTSELDSAPPQAEDHAPDPRLTRELEKALISRRNTIIVMPIVALVTAAHYAGKLSLGGLPEWCGFIVLGICTFQVILTSFKISKLRAHFDEFGPEGQ